MNPDINFYKKNGYFLIKGFFDKQCVNDLLNESKNVFFRQFKFKAYTSAHTLADLSEKQFNEFLYRLFAEDLECLSNCGKQIQHLIKLHALSLDAKVVHLLKDVGLNSPTISTRPVMYFNHPKLAKTKVFHQVDAHQDWRSMQGSLNSAVIWVPLVDVNISLGALQILPGSHLMGLKTNHIENGFGMVVLSSEEQAKMISVEVEIGDVLIFSSFLIHQSGENITDTPRWSCHFRYNDLDEDSFIKRKFAHPYLYKPAEDLITPNFPLLDEIRKKFST